MHPALRKGPVFYKKTPPPIFHLKHTPISFPAYGPGRGRPRTAWMDNIKTCTGLSVEESIRMTEGLR